MDIYESIESIRLADFRRGGFDLRGVYVWVVVLLGYGREGVYCTPAGACGWVGGPDGE